MNQSETNNNSNNSRRNTNENIFNQDYSNFFNDWRTIHYFQQGKQTPIHHKKSGYENFQEIDKTPQNQRNSGYDMKSFDIDLNRVRLFNFIYIVLSVILRFKRMEEQRL